MCCSARAAPISATSRTPSATNAIRDRAARRATASTVLHAVLGTSDECIATYPGDFAQALIALDATVEIAGPRGTRNIPFAALHRKPEGAPEIETTLAGGRNHHFVCHSGAPGPAARSFSRCATANPTSSRSPRPRSRSISATARCARRGSRSAASRPCPGGRLRRRRRSRARRSTRRQAKPAADAAFTGARTHEHNAFKVELGKRTLMRALDQAAAMEI